MKYLDFYDTLGLVNKYSSIILPELIQNPLPLILFANIIGKSSWGLVAYSGIKIL